MPKRHYTEKAKADALAVLQAHGGNVSGAAKALGIPEATLRLWSTEQGKQRAAPAETREESKKDLANTLTQARWLYLERLMDPAAVKTTSGYYAAVTFKVLNEAHQLLTGGPTARIEGNLADFLRGSGALPKPAELPKIAPKEAKSVPLSVQN